MESSSGLKRRPGMTVKITSFEAENVKRIKAVQLQPTENGLTVIGGRNNQGKTSVLDAIAWTLGGNRLKPSDPHRSGSVRDPEVKIKLSNGLIVERSGKNGDLKVTDPSGKKSGQALLDSLIGEMALNIPKFMEMNSKDKARKMLKMAGVEEQLAAIDKEKEELSNERLFIGRQVRAKEETLKGMERYPDAGIELMSPKKLLEQQQEILLRNAENAKKRSRLAELEKDLERLNRDISDMENHLAVFKNNRMKLMQDLEIGHKDAVDLYDESTEELEADVENIERHNLQVRANQAFKSAADEAKALRAKYQDLNSNIMELDQERLNLLKTCNLPLPGLSVDDKSELIYNGQRWDGMSGSDQLKVAAAICQKMNPECGFVLMDKLEQMDQQTMNEFGHWLESQGLQAIATRVSTGDECSIIIEDGQVKGKTTNDSERPDQNRNLGPAWSW